jgi:phage pi2 protein 07
MPKKDLIKDTLAMVEQSLKDVDYQELQEKAVSVWQDLSVKAKNFAEDERVQEIAAKAKEFATDTMNQIFTTAKEKFQEWSDANSEKAKVMASIVEDSDESNEKLSM